jgi:peptidoglycan-associated lipoprotein
MNMSTYKQVALLVALTAMTACGSDPKPPPAAPSGAEEAPPAAPEKAQINSKPDDDASKGQIAISDEIRRACGISDADAYFDFDSANVQPAAKAIMQKLAVCFTTGPLKGRKMSLVGHADPRGEEEYNMVLGGRRSDNVKRVLGSLGLPNGQSSTTSRGEIDASGTDEAGWARDRRVDVVLAN